MFLKSLDIIRHIYVYILIQVRYLKIAYAAIHIVLHFFSETHIFIFYKLNKKYKQWTKTHRRNTFRTLGAKYIACRMYLNLLTDRLLVQRSGEKEHPGVYFIAFVYLGTNVMIPRYLPVNYKCVFIFPCPRVVSNK